MLVVLSERSSRQPTPASQIDTDRISQTMRLLGCRVLEIPVLGDDEDVRDYLDYLPTHDEPTPCLYNGFIPTLERYQHVYDACAEKNVWLLNTPAQCARALSLVEAYPLIESLTPDTVAITDISMLDAALEEVGLPVFLKGSVKSLKKHGVDACVAHTVAQAHEIAETLFAHEYFTRGTVLVRAFVELKHTQITSSGLPAGREFRVFLYRHEVLTYGYYWDGQDALEHLTSSEEHAICALARSASKALDVPYLAIDVGQRHDGEFIVIEPGDAQFAGLSKVDPLALLGKLVQHASCLSQGV